MALAVSPYLREQSCTPLEKQAKSESEPRDAWKSVSMDEVIEETAACYDLAQLRTLDPPRQGASGPVERLQLSDRLSRIQSRPENRKPIPPHAKRTLSKFYWQKFWMMCLKPSDQRRP